MRSKKTQNFIYVQANFNASKIQKMYKQIRENIQNYITKDCTFVLI